jgi:hypothetical protein
VPTHTALTIVDNVPGTWIDISGTGAALGLDDDDSVDFQSSRRSTVSDGTVPQNPPPR